MKAVLNKLYELLELTKKVDFLAPLALRLYLVPIFWMAGTKKWGSFDSTVEWFGNSDWGLGLPFPLVLAFLATWTEICHSIGYMLMTATFRGGRRTHYVRKQAMNHSVPMMTTVHIAME